MPYIRAALSSTWERSAGNFVITGKKRDVHVRNIKPGTTSSWNRCRYAKKSVFHPDSVLKQQRHHANGEGKIKGKGSVRHTANDCSQVAFEISEINVRIKVLIEFVIVKQVACVMRAVVQRRHEHVKSFRGSDLQIHVQIQFHRGASHVVAVLRICPQPPIGNHRRSKTAGSPYCVSRRCWNRDSIGPSWYHGQTELKDRTLIGIQRFAFIDVHLVVRVIVQMFPEGIGRKIIASRLNQDRSAIHLRCVVFPVITLFRVAQPA